MHDIRTCLPALIELSALALTLSKAAGQNFSPPSDLPGANKDGLVADVAARKLTPGEEKLFLAANTGDLELLEQAIEAGADVNTPEPTHGGTALHIACSNFTLDPKVRRRLRSLTSHSFLLSLITPSTYLWCAPRRCRCHSFRDC